VQLTIALAAELGNQTVVDEMAGMMASRDIQNQMGPDGSLPFEVHFFCLLVISVIHSSIARGCARRNSSCRRVR
jgi:hypothetical protein